MSGNERMMSDPYRLRAYAVMDGNEPHEGAAIAQWLEDEIERRGLQLAYSNALVALIGYNGTEPITWAVLRATPEQRARAFVEATNER